MELNPKVSSDQQLEAERAVIGAMLIDTAIVRDVLATVEEKDFTNPDNRLIYQAARALFRAGEPVDAFTLRNQVGAKYAAYMAELMEITPTSAIWRTYAKLMHEQATLLQVHELARRLVAAVTLTDCRPLSADLGQLLADRKGVDAWNMREMLEDFFRSQDPDQPPVEYIRCGISEIDRGAYIQCGDVMIIGGYPNDGKTALALMTAYHMAASKKVGFFSLETDKDKVRDRMISHVAQIDFGEIKRREMDEGAWKSVADIGSDFTKRDLTVLRASGMTVSEIQAVSEAYGFDIIFIDYVQLVESEIGRYAKRSEQMADVSRALHIFAQKTKTLVVELAQLARPERSAGWREPNMHDLKESGQFEQDADIIFLLYRPDPKQKAFDQERHRFLRIAKNKEGRRGKWPLYFDGAKQTFSVMVGGPSQPVADIQRKLVSDGRRAKEANHAAAQTAVPGSGYTQTTFAELRETDPNAPF